MSDNTQELRSILGEIPNYIFEYLELSDDIKKEWKLGSKASDFGGHNQFVQRFTTRIEALIKSQTNQAVLEARIDELEKLPRTSYKLNAEVSHLSILLQSQHIKERLATLRKELSGGTD